MSSQIYWFHPQVLFRELRRISPCILFPEHKQSGTRTCTFFILFEYFVAPTWIVSLRQTGSCSSHQVGLILIQIISNGIITYLVHLNSLTVQDMRPIDRKIISATRFIGNESQHQSIGRGIPKTVGGRRIWEVRRESLLMWAHVSWPSLGNVVGKMLSWRLSPGTRQIPSEASSAQHSHNVFGFYVRRNVLLIKNTRTSRNNLIAHVHTHLGQPPPPSLWVIAQIMELFR